MLSMSYIVSFPLIILIPNHSLSWHLKFAQSILHTELLSSRRRV